MHVRGVSDCLGTDTYSVPKHKGNFVFLGFYLDIFVVKKNSKSCEAHEETEVYPSELKSPNLDQ